MAAPGGLFVVEINMPTDIPEELSKDPWFKIVEFLQQNWAVVIEREKDVLVVFYGDTCGVFDEMPFPTRNDAERALRRNGFSKFMDDKEAQQFIGLPRGRFTERPHPNGRIYSSGRFWVEETRNKCKIGIQERHLMSPGQNPNVMSIEYQMSFSSIMSSCAYRFFCSIFILF